MKFVTSNEKNSLTPTQVGQDCAKIFNDLSPDPIVCWQEIAGTDRLDKVAALQANSPSGSVLLFPELPIPITLPPRFPVVTGTGADSGYVNIKGYTPEGDNPRYVAWVKVQDSNTPSLPPFYIVNTHFSAGCNWPDNETPTLEDPTEDECILRSHWWECFWQAKKVVNIIKNADFTSMIGGDFNKPKMERFGSAQLLAVGATSIDKLISIERSVRLTVNNTGTVITQSDHNAQYVDWSTAPR